MNPLRLGVNIDHVATIRNARGGQHPDPVKAAWFAMQAGADGITAHLREDRRHIRDQDMERLKKEIPLPLNFEMAATEEMQDIALRIKPNAVCLVPEKRQEVTTEGGLDVVSAQDYLKNYINPFKQAGIRVSLFIDADKKQIDASMQAGADSIELHTGKYCETPNGLILQHISDAAHYAHMQGLEVHAGHGLDFDTVSAIAAIACIKELNIGHFLIGEAIFTGLEAAILKMKSLMLKARNK